MKFLLAVLLSTLGAFAQSTHSVTLNWTAPASGATPASYNVYRGTISGGPYVIVGSVTAPSVSYIDTANLVEGQKYFYVVTSVNQGGESADSNEASALIPFSKPSPPTNLTATPK